MRHAILGAGGVGGLLAAALKRSGADVTLVVRSAAPATIALRSTLFGDIEVAVDSAAQAPVDTDVVWVAVKANGLVDAFDRARLDDAVVIPLLNGIDHVALLRERYQRVCPGTIRVASHRLAPGVIEQTSPFAHIAVATGEYGAAALALAEAEAAGFATSTSDDETTLLWDKLAFLAPIALATTARDRPLGGVRDDPAFETCQREAVALAQRDGATTQLDTIQALTRAAPAQMRSSMQLDVEHGRAPELDAIAGPLLRRAGPGGAAATRAFVAAIRARSEHADVHERGLSPFVHDGSQGA